MRLNFLSVYSLKASWCEFGDEYAIELAEGGEEALELMDELCEDGYRTLVIVSDWLMPEMKGDEFLIQAHRKFPSVLKLMLTGQADPAAIERSRNEANLYRQIDKPWDASELVDAIRSGARIGVRLVAQARSPS